MQQLRPRPLFLDSAMLDIKASSEGAGVHYNSFGKPNRMFAWFVIEFLAMSPSEHQKYLDNYGYAAPYAWKWLGAGGKI